MFGQPVDLKQPALPHQGDDLLLPKRRGVHARMVWVWGRTVNNEKYRN
jgi:hypothetical protein